MSLSKIFLPDWQHDPSKGASGGIFCPVVLKIIEFLIVLFVGRSLTNLSIFSNLFSLVSIKDLFRRINKNLTSEQSFEFFFNLIVYFILKKINKILKRRKSAAEKSDSVSVDFVTLVQIPRQKVNLISRHFQKISWSLDLKFQVPMTSSFRVLLSTVGFWVATRFKHSALIT